VTSSRPSFLPQAAFILIPILLLAALASKALLDDERQILSDARNEAQVLAPRVADSLDYAIHAQANINLKSAQTWRLRLLSTLLSDDRLAWETCGSAFLIGQSESSADWAKVWPDAKLTNELPSLIPPNSTLGPPHILLWSSKSARSPQDPPPTILPSVPPPWLASLSPTEFSHWKSLLLRAQASASASDSSLVAELETLASHTTSKELAANATLEAMVLRKASINEWFSFLQQNGRTLSDSGIPIAVRGTIQTIQAWNSSPESPTQSLLIALLRTLLRDSSAFDSQLIAHARHQSLSKLEQLAPNLDLLDELVLQQNRSRRMFTNLPHSLTHPASHRYSWLTDPDGPCLSYSFQFGDPNQPTIPPQPQPAAQSPSQPVPPIDHPESLVHVAVLIPHSTLREIAENVRTSVRLPNWAGVSILLHGQRLNFNADGVDLATAESSFSPPLYNPNRPPLKSAPLSATITLADPSALLVQVHRRQLIYGLLILGVVAAAALGLFHAKRSFSKQLQLAEMKSGFVSSVSHELRTPIASIRLLAEGLEQGVTSHPQQQKEFLRLIVQECRRLSGLIENVLDYARIEQSRKEYEFEPLDPIRLVSDTVRIMTPCADLAQVRLESILPPSQESTPQPSWDGSAIQQLLINLIDNAIKHSPPQSIVRVSLVFPDITHPDHPPTSNAHIQLCVQDQGAGIPITEQARIFDQFYRRGSELRRETRGIGIGLTLARHTAEAHGGSITVQSAPGKGSTFVVSLPIAPPATQSRPPRRS